MVPIFKKILIQKMRIFYEKISLKRSNISLIVRNYSALKSIPKNGKILPFGLDFSPGPG
jgi:hypothetical protein